MPNQPKGWQAVVSRIDQAIAALEALPSVCADAYGTTKFRARPIIDRHFMADNGTRYNWPGLAASTLHQKMGGAAAANKAAKARGWVATKAAGALGKGVLPMLVATGALRNAILESGRVERTGIESARITWTVPDYAHWHVTGGSKAGRPPMRNFLKPNAEDIEQVRQIGQQFIDQAIGEGRVSFGPSI